VFFVLVSERDEEFRVSPPEVIREIVVHNRGKHGKRKNNLSGERAELDLDVEVQGKPLTALCQAYKNDFTPILERLGVGGQAQGVVLQVRSDVTLNAPQWYAQRSGPSERSSASCAWRSACAGERPARSPS
jgi:hypothetical protein